MRTILIIIALLIGTLIYSQSQIKTYYDPISNTQLKEVYQVKPNTPIKNGNYKLYDEYGNLVRDINFFNNIQNGKDIYYYGAVEASLESEKVRMKCLGQISKALNYKNGVLDGLQNYYNYTSEGKRYLMRKETYSNGEMNKLVLYYENGNEKGNVQVGNCYEYYENGKKLAEYIKDENWHFQGKFTSWYASGVKEIEGEYVNNLKNGVWIEYNEDGVVKAKREYDLGEKVLTEEELLLEERKVKKEEEDKIKETQRIEKESVERQEKERVRKEEDKNREINERKLKELNDLNSNFKIEDALIATNYKYWNNDRYEYKKPRLLNSYIEVVNYIGDFISNPKNELDEKIELANIRFQLASKLNESINLNTKSLENELKKADNIEQKMKILNQYFGLK